MQKMSRSNVKARRWMEANGYKDIFFTPHTRWSKDIIFQAKEFDGIASHEDRIVLFQIKSNRKPTKQKVREYDALAAQFSAEFLWFNCSDRKPIEVNNLQGETFLITSPQLIP